MKQRTGDPWIPADQYGRRLPRFTVNAGTAGARIVQPATTKGHGWREVMVEDPDGYVWAVGLPTGASG